MKNLYNRQSRVDQPQTPRPKRSLAIPLAIVGSLACVIGYLLWANASNGPTTQPAGGSGSHGFAHSFWGSGSSGESTVTPRGGFGSYGRGIGG